MTSQPIHVGDLNSTFISVSMTATANTDRTGAAGVFTKIGTCGAGKGSRIDRIDVQATGVTTAGRILLFEADAGGGNKRLFGELVVTAQGTVDATNSAFRDTFYFNGSAPRHFNAGREIWAATTKAEAFIARIDGGDL
jgi:hypothetical protein